MYMKFDHPEGYHWIVSDIFLSPLYYGGAYCCLFKTKAYATKLIEAKSQVFMKRCV